MKKFLLLSTGILITIAGIVIVNRFKIDKLWGLLPALLLGLFGLWLIYCCFDKLSFHEWYSRMAIWSLKITHINSLKNDPLDKYLATRDPHDFNGPRDIIRSEPMPISNNRLDIVTFLLNSAVLIATVGIIMNRYSISINYII